MTTSFETAVIRAIRALKPGEVASYGEIAVSIADMSRTTHVTAELVDVGAGVGVLGEQDDGFDAGVLRGLGQRRVVAVRRKG